MLKYSGRCTIKIDKEYEWIQYEDLMRACRELNGAALKFFIYLTTCFQGEEIEVSPQHIMQETGISLNSEKNAFKELQLKKYLIEEKPGFFIFNPTKN